MNNEELCDHCAKRDFDYQMCIAIMKVAKEYGLTVKGSVLPTDEKDVYRIRFTTSPAQAGSSNL